MLVAIIIDIIQLWLSISVLLSWLPRAWFSKYYKYLFPTPNIPIRPAAMLGSGANTGGGMMNFGINVGPMFVTWFLRYLNRKVEMWYVQKFVTIMMKTFLMISHICCF